MHSRFDYFLFYKPFQVLSQFSAEGDKKTLADFFKGIKKDIYPVGRLDYDSEGILLLTNNKQLNHRLLNPLFVHEKEYWVEVEGVPTKEALNKLEQGTLIKVDGQPYQTKPAGISLMTQAPTVPDRFPPVRFRKNIPTSWLSITLTEGKNRQVRRMTASVNLPTLRLIRYRIGAINIKDRQPGSIWSIPEDQIQNLFLRST